MPCGQAHRRKRQPKRQQDPRPQTCTPSSQPRTPNAQTRSLLRPTPDPSCRRGRWCALRGVSRGRRISFLRLRRWILMLWLGRRILMLRLRRRISFLRPRRLTLALQLYPRISSRSTLYRHGARRCPQPHDRNSHKAPRNNSGESPVTPAMDRELFFLLWWLFCCIMVVVSWRVKRSRAGGL